MVNYQLGKIYKIVDNTTNKIYIGSTCEPTLARRLAKHTSNYNQFLKGNYQNVSSFEIIKNGDYDIVLVEAFPCNSKDELHSRERLYIENNICVNKNIPTRTLKEYQKIYQENNKDRIKENKKIYWENNKDTIKEYQKEYQKIYQEKNKEQIKFKKSEKIICDICNRQYTKSDKSRHRKSKFHLNCIEHDED